MDKVAVIIVTFNGENYIRNCLSSLSNSSISIKIIVIDNNSKDRTVEIIGNEYSDVELIQLSENIGFGAANNLGLRRVIDLGYNFAYLLNQDAYIFPDSIKQIVAVANRNIDYGILGSLQLNGKGDKLDNYFCDYIAPRYCRDFVSDIVVGNQLSDCYEIDFINAAAWLLPVKILRIIGGFDPLFYHYGEDNNYIQRVRYYGFKIGLCPKSVVLHDRENIKTKLRTKNISERHLLVRFADVNDNAPLAILRYRQSLLKQIIRRVVRCKHPKELLRQYLWLSRNKQRILDSWERNRIIGLKYI